MSHTREHAAKDHVTLDPACPGKLVIVSGPSGAGKTTIVRRVLRVARVPLWLSVSATTRPPRPGEVDGVDYHFLSPAEFTAWRESGEFLESFEVFGRGHWYGTPRRPIGEQIAVGRWPLLEIDVHGALAVAEQCPEAITIFIRPSSIVELERRLRGRGTETDEAIAARLAVASNELGSAHRYKHEVVNDDVEQAVSEICNLLSRYRENDKT